MTIVVFDVLVVFVIVLVIASIELSVVLLSGTTIQYVNEVTIRNITTPISCKICSLFTLYIVVKC